MRSPSTGMCQFHIPHGMPGLGWMPKLIGPVHSRPVHSRRCDTPLGFEPACRNRPSQKEPGYTTGLGRQLGTPCQTHPVIGGLADTVIFDNHRRQTISAQNVLQRGKALSR